MNATGNDTRKLLLVTLLIFLTRIPFIFNGYGSEEDAWGLILIARKIALSGVYEVSRLPGHPVQEYLLTFLYNLPAWQLNLMTAVVSSMGVLFFMLTLRKLSVPDVIPAGIAFAFVPVFYIHSTNIMDYTWALALVMLAFYLMTHNRYLLAGIVIGIASGFRITAGGMIIPLVIWHFFKHRSLKAVIASGAVTLVTALICFIPPLKTYGMDFFTYYEYFPYPPFLKNVYKGSIGAWGLPGTIMLLYFAGKTIAGWKNRDKGQFTNHKPMIIVAIVVILMYTYSFLKIPQKTAFVLPLVPFVILLFALLLDKRDIKIFAATMIISCFLFGINLDDASRGSRKSALAVSLNVGNTPVSFDVLSGLVTADYSKRQQKIDYAKTVVKEFQTAEEKTVVIAGFWQNELNYFSLLTPNPKVSYLYYANEDELQDSIATGNKILYLPEQDYYNNLRFDKTFTEKYATPYK